MIVTVMLLLLLLLLRAKALALAGVDGSFSSCTHWCASVRSLHRQLLRIKSAQAAAAVGTFV